MSTNPGQRGDGVEAETAIKVPNSPSTAFAALSLSDETSASSSSSSSASIFTPAHLRELEASTALVSALDAARKQPKPLIRSTGHLVPRISSSEDTDHHHHLLSWKVAEFAYRKSTSVGSELPTLARGLFTERIEASSPSEKHRIVVRGYDKFFNLGEMAWTRPESIALHTTAPYVMTFKENGCIIFISALSPEQLVVTSKHSLGSIEGTEVTHAQKGHEWLLRHLASVGRTEQQLAQELWNRNETAAFELCDDSFEEHVLAYSAARSGLHLHGLNVNSADFRTRSMPDVDAFAKEWGFIPTRWLQLDSLEEVQRVTSEIEQTGAWEGEAIEGFVIRTHMPDGATMSRLNRDEVNVVSPPYQPGQAWFYKVKFDEPYLMYRDWRELARRMVKEKHEWEAKVASFPVGNDATEASSSAAVVAEEPVVNGDIDAVDADGKPRSKAALKRERKRQAKAAAATAARSAVQSGLVPPPPPPQPRSKRPETLAFITWCYDRLYGTGTVAPQPHLFAGLTQNKGIIAMRTAFLSYLASTRAATPAPVETEDTREYTKTVLAPVAVPGCGKTVLAVALGELFSVGHVQSDDFKKKTGFLNAIERNLRTHAAQSNYVLFADKNNHLFQHRDDLVDLTARLSQPCTAGAAASKKKPPAEIGRIRTIALAWDLDRLPLNTLHRLCAQRIEQRGDNHQTLVADPDRTAVVGLKSHETVLWRFLEALQPFQSSVGKGQGAEGYGDSAFDHVVRLKVAASAEENLRTVVKSLSSVLGWTMPSDTRIGAALTKAMGWKVARPAKGERQESKRVRYFGLAVELDVGALVDSVLPVADELGSMRDRLNLRPHITLVHHTSLTTTGESVADRRWAFYTRLLSSSNPTAVFHVSISTLLYDQTVLALPVDQIIPPSELNETFNSLHANIEGQDAWTPHITLATSPEVRPFEANRLVAQWRRGETRERTVKVIPLQSTLSVEARVFGMS